MTVARLQSEMSIAEMYEWVAYYSLQDKATREDVELQVAQEQSDEVKTVNLFDFLRGVTPAEVKK